MKPSWHEVDAGRRGPAVGLVQVRRAGEPVAELGHGVVGAPPVVAHLVAVAAVPLRPQRGEVADLVAALAHVPGLGDELHLGDDGVLLDEVEEGRELVHVVQLARQRRGQVEAEAVDVQVLHPVAQRVHDQLEHVGVAHVQAVAGARVVDVPAQVGGVEPVVGGVVEAPQRQQRPPVVALAGVVVDDVQDDLDAGGVQHLDQLLELLDLLAPAAVGGVGVVGGEEADRVVAPVVAQAGRHQALVVQELVDRQQLDGGHPQSEEVVDHGRVPEARVGAPQLGRHVGVAHGQAPDVGLVHQRLVPRGPRVAVVAPVEVRVGHHHPGHVRGAVEGRRRAVGVVGVGPEHRRVPVHLTLDGLGVGVDQQLVRVAAVPLGRGPRPVHPVAVALPGLHPGHVAVVHEAGHLGQLDAALDAVVVEQAQLDGVGHLGEDREVGARPVVGRAQGLGLARPDLHDGGV